MTKSEADASSCSLVMSLVSKFWSLCDVSREAPVIIINFDAMSIQLVLE